MAAQIKRALFFEDLANKKKFKKVNISLAKQKDYLHLCSPQQRKELRLLIEKQSEKNKFKISENNT
ncbi:hypothetical protein [Mucilaginibacter sp. UYNi724]